MSRTGLHSVSLHACFTSNKVPTKKMFSTVLLILLVFLVAPVPKAIAGPFRDYSTIISAFKNLANNHPTQMTYEAIGKTVEGRDILMFKIGNPDGGKVMFDGAMHGWESLGGEVLYYYAKWLLTSSDPLAKRVLANTYTLLIPALNADRYNIGRKNAHGVDLNRNFATNWYRGDSDPNSEEYRGPSALSEPESKTVVNIFNKLKPDFYVNLHGGSSELYAGYNGNRTQYESLFNKIASLSSQRHVTSYSHQYLNAGGYAISDGVAAGVTSFLLEVTDQSTISPSQVETVVLPKFIPVAAVLSIECENTSRPWDINKDGKTDLLDLTIACLAYSTTPNSPSWNPAADIDKNGIVNLLDISIITSHYCE